MTKSTDEGGHTTVFAYNADSRLIKQKDAERKRGQIFIVDKKSIKGRYVTIKDLTPFFQNFIDM